MFGFLNVNKDSGKTSRQIVTAVKRVVRPAKVGHAGTLDPLATGVLVVCVGSATRLVRFIQQQPKTYIADFRLGQTSDSLDTETEIRNLESAPVPTEAQLQSALEEFTGTIQQKPPAYSAIKINGKRAYQLARRGEEVELAARPIEIQSLRLLNYSYPDFQVEIGCGSGTYVRSLGRDIGERLDSAAIMTALVRTAIGSFRLEDAIESDALTNRDREFERDDVLPRIVNPTVAFPNHEKVVVTADLVKHIGAGGILPETTAAGFEGGISSEFVTIDESGNLVAYMTRKPGIGYTPSINFADKLLSNRLAE